MEVKFLNQNPCMPSGLGVFQFGIFFNVVLSVLMSIFAFGPSSSLSNSFPCCLSIRPFCYVLLVAIFCSKIVLLSSHLVVGMFSCYLPLLADRISSLFWNVLFCLHCFTLYRYLFNLPSFASIFWFISLSFIVIFLMLLFPFCLKRFLRFFVCFIIFACCQRFLICLSSRISHPGFEFMFVLFLGEPRFFFHRLISLRHRLVCLIPWYF